MVRRAHIMNEKRKHKRFRVDVSEINGSIVFISEVNILDISLSGISLKIDRRLNMGVEYKLKLEGSRSINLKGTVVWCKLSEMRKVSEEEVVPIYTVGLEFRDMSEEKLMKLQHLIRNHMS